MNITNLTTTQLRQIIAIKEQIEALQSQIDSIAGGEVPIPARRGSPRSRQAQVSHVRRPSSANSLKALAKARKIRWAKLKAAKRGKRRIGAAVRR